MRTLRLISAQKRLYGSSRLHIADYVSDALRNGQGVVALESTVITHGLPYPNNLQTAKDMEEQVRKSGSQPATIAIIGGEVHVGLSNTQLEDLAKCESAVKVSTRDIAKTLVKKQVGGTTVAATMRIAHQAGIRVFATGGIGGVHRGAEQTFDVSADLQELSRTPVCVVCSGVKSILDIPKTLEYLETHAVNCIVYGEENAFPNFFTRRSEGKAQFNTTDLEEIIQILRASEEFNLSGTVLACPIPKEHEADGQTIQKAIEQALKEAVDRQIVSQDVTPFILSRINALTKGSSMKTNIALLKNNANIAGKLADMMAKNKIASRNSPVFSAPVAPLKSSNVSSKKPLVVSIGAAIADFEAITNKNIKDFSRVAVVAGVPSATYLSMNNHGNILFGVSSIDQILQHITPELIAANEDVLSAADYILLDSNLSVDAMRKAIEIGDYHKRKIWLDPTDLHKVGTVFSTGLISKVTAVSPNANEFRQWVSHCGAEVPESMYSSTYSTLEVVARSSHQLMQGVSILVISLADKGTAVVFKNRDGKICTRNLAAPIEAKKIVSVSGAGDSFNSGVIASLAHGRSLDEALEVGQKCAALSLQTTEAVSTCINSSLLH